MECKAFRGKTGPEDQLAIEVANFLRAATLERRLLCTWTHIPHEVGGGAKMARVRYSLAKAMGLITGSGDYVFVGQCGGGWIELKSKTGSLTPQQKDFREWCSGTGVNHAVCRSLEEVVHHLKSWELLG